ncbi:MAG TPA: saccharopine dehydrogenase NADP-binding domain-containing protein [Burkholderiaceae bacterium]
MKTVILGGYGNFGARIARALAHDPAIELLIAGRDAHQASKLAGEVGGQPMVVDLGAHDLAERLRALGTGLVIHTAGPFQGQDFAVARACAAAGAHYVDLADSRRFVCDFGGLLAGDFVRAERVAITGASTLPALSTAVIDALRLQFEHIETIHICIAPAQKAPRGVATLAAVLSYCGKPVRVWQGGRWLAEPGWSAPVEEHFARMPPRLGALCDVPDLELLPERYAGVQTARFHAALEVGLAQRSFAAVAWLTRRGFIRSPQKLAGLIQRVAPIADGWGTDEGGMVVRLSGQGMDGQPRRVSWHLTAGGNHGPEIPCMAATLLARRLAAGEPFAPGARACMGMLRLDEFTPDFERWGMVTDTLVEQGGA